jgi:hypothetical protein
MIFDIWVAVFLGVATSIRNCAASSEGVRPHLSPAELTQSVIGAQCRLCVDRRCGWSGDRFAECMQDSDH